MLQHFVHHCSLMFEHCIVRPSIYGLLLLLWYL